MENIYLSTQPIIRSKIFGLIPAILIVFSFVFMTTNAFSQNEKDVEIVRECIEYIGDGKYQVNFGYNNPNKNEITVPQENSIVEKNSGNAYGHTKFKPGRQHNVFSEEFNYTEEVRWVVLFSNGSHKEVIADANSSHCSGDENLIPLFDGKEEGGVLWPELYWLGQQTDQPESNEIFQIDNSSEKVLIEVIAFEGMDMATLRTELFKRGFSDEIPDGENPLVITGFYPINNLDFFNKNPLQNYVNFVRPMFTPIRGAFDGLGDLYDYQGLVNTEQDIAMRSHIVRKAFNFTGEDVTIGFLSDSYGIPPVGSKDVPQGEAIEIVWDLPDLGPFSGGSDEGRAMIEQAFDIAPGAKYKFWTGVGSPEHMALGIRTLADENLPYKCDVIVDDILHLAEPFMPIGQIAAAVAEVTADGVHYVSSAGNSRDAGYRDTFDPIDIPLEFTSFVGSTAKAHNFKNSNSDYPQVQEIKLTPGVYIIEMQYDNPFYAQGETVGATDDLDFWILDKFGNKKYFGNRLNEGEDPIEILGFQVLFPTELYVMITGENIPPGLSFEYIVLRAPLDENKEFGWTFSNTGDAFNATTIVGHSASDVGSTVGAAFYGYTPAFDYQPDKILEEFSSIGGTNLVGEVLAKPDFIGPDGGNNTFFGSDIDFDDTDGYNDGKDFLDGKNFFGTSAAAPAVAAMEALILEASKRVKDNSGAQPIKKEITPSDLKTVLINSSLDVGLDLYTGGSGLVQADRALLNMANPSPKILALDFTEPNPGLVEFTMTITMQYPIINESGDPIIYQEDDLGVPISNGATEISFLGQTLSWAQADTETSWDPENYILEMEVDIPTFTENPEITLTNAAQKGTLPGSNGGTASLNILDTPKEYVLIKAQNFTKLYGQDPPVYNGNIDGLTFDIYTRDASLDWVASTNPEYETLKTYLVSAIELTTAVIFDTEVGLYSININIAEGEESVIEALMAEFNIVNFINNGEFANLGDGGLTVDPLPVTVKPQDILDAVYGEKINIVLDYLFDETNMSNPDAVRALIKTSHDELLAPSDFFAIASRGAQLIDRGAQLIDRGAQLIDRGAQLIDGSSWMMTEEVLNRGAALIDGGNTIYEIGEVVAENFILDEPTSTSDLNRGAALIDATTILDGTATIFNRGAQLIDGAGAVINRGAALIDRGAALIDAEEKASIGNFKLFFIASDSEPESSDQTKYNLGIETLRSVNFVSGLDVLPENSDYMHYIAPGTLLNKNLIVTYEIADLVFNPRELKIQVEDTQENQSKTYGMDDPSFTYTLISGSLIPEISPNPAIPNDLGNPGDAFFGSLTREPGEDVEIYNILLGDLKAGPSDGIIDNPDIPFGLNYGVVLEGEPQFEIKPSTLFVSATIGENPIFAGDPLSDALIIIEYGSPCYPDNGFKWQDDASIFGSGGSDITTREIDTGSPYSGFSGVYEVIFNSNNDNYIITQIQKDDLLDVENCFTDDGILYVNPFDDQHVHPRLDCIEENLDYSSSNTDPDDPNSYQYIAHMYYDNPYETAVYLPAGGERNLLYYASGTGTFLSVQQPSIFYPGQDMGLFDVYFDGNRMIWALTSGSSTKTAAISSNASEGSARCKQSGARIEGATEVRSTSAQFTISEINGYPNPVSDMYFIQLNEELVSSVKVNLVDIQGKLYDVHMTRNLSRRQLEIDLTKLNSGLYLLKLDFNNDQKILKIIIQ